MYKDCYHHFALKLCRDSFSVQGPITVQHSCVCVDGEVAAEMTRQNVKLQAAIIAPWFILVSGLGGELKGFLVNLHFSNKIICLVLEKDTSRYPEFGSISLLSFRGQ